MSELLLVLVLANKSRFNFHFHHYADIFRVGRCLIYLTLFHDCVTKFSQTMMTDMKHYDTHQRVKDHHHELPSSACVVAYYVGESYIEETLTGLGVEDY